MQFTGDDITITVGAYTLDNGKHKMADPRTANAHFICNGKLYAIENAGTYAFVEDWYFEELLPKFQMLTVLTMMSDPAANPGNFQFAT